MKDAKFTSRLAKHTVLVLSGKGGVGKSTTTLQLALSANQCAGLSVGVLDIDLCGPSLARLFGVEGSQVLQDEKGWTPVKVHEGLWVMSLAFLLPSKSDAVIWRGPKKTAMIRQFLSDVAWPTKLDLLLIDTPPGTSDEHLAIVESVHPLHAVVVTTPQVVSVQDVARQIRFCQQVQVNILGIVENMSGFVCPHCSECTHLFAKGGGRGLAERYKLEFLGGIPVDPGLAALLDRERKALASEYAGLEVAKSMKDIVDRLQAALAQTDTNDDAA